MLLKGFDGNIVQKNSGLKIVVDLLMVLWYDAATIFFKGNIENENKAV